MHQPNLNLAGYKNALRTYLSINIPLLTSLAHRANLSTSPVNPKKEHITHDRSIKPHFVFDSHWVDRAYSSLVFLWKSIAEGRPLTRLRFFVYPSYSRAAGTTVARGFFYTRGPYDTNLST
jgi:hypothetical protein